MQDAEKWAILKKAVKKEAVQTEEAIQDAQSVQYLQRLWENTRDGAIDLAINLLLAFIVLKVGLKIAKIICARMDKGLRKREMEPGVRSFIHSTLSIVLNAAVIITAALTAGVATSTFVTLLASCGVAIGLAMQGALTNFAGGLMLLFFHPFKVGDYIISGQYEGYVREITAFYTYIQSRDHQRITLPNGNLTNNVVVNCSGEGVRRLALTFGVAYNSEDARVREAILGVARGEKQVKTEPAPLVYQTSQADSALEYTLYAWCASEDYWYLKDRLNEEIVAKLMAEHIEIPFPQRDVNVRLPEELLGKYK